MKQMTAVFRAVLYFILQCYCNGTVGAVILRRKFITVFRVSVKLEEKFIFGVCNIKSFSTA